MKCREECLVELLKEQKLHITTAESCTGGLIASTIINVSGASAVLDQGLITYSNEAKERLLGVRGATLSAYGAVSRETAEEMARGAAASAGAEVGLSSTGIAGPDGGTKEKPVGLVYLGCYVQGQVTVKKCLFSGNRESIRRQAVETALDLAVDCLKKEKEKSE